MNTHRKNPWATKVIYQIYPRSFKDNNNDGIGDIRGIIQKLDYINDDTERSLGIDAVWISPIYKSPMADFGYDITDFCDLEPMFGTLDDFDLLVKELHARNMQIIMDYIPSHTSIEHPWFQESRSSRNNPKRDWYIWHDPKKDGMPPNNWISAFGGSRWEHDEKTGQYYLHTFIKEQADLNWRNPEVVETMLNVLRFWLKRGVDGFRVDAFDHIFKDTQFRDEPPNEKYIPGEMDPFNAQKHIYTTAQPELHDTIRLFQKVLDEFGDKFMVTESYEIPIEHVVKLYKAGTPLHSPFNFEFITLPWDAQVYQKFIDEYDGVIPSSYVPNYILGNHDRHRVATRLGRDGARVAAMLQLTLRGMPTIYYGDEIGMQDVDVPPEKVQDPWEKNIPGERLGRDPVRTPMQWTREKYAGFSTVEPWLPVGNDYHAYNVEAEKSDPRSFFSLYRFLIHYRKKSKTLLYGSYSSVKLANPAIFAYVREYEDEKLLIVLNFANKGQDISLSFKDAKILCNSFLQIRNKQVDLSTLSLKPHEGYLCEL